MNTPQDETSESHPKKHDAKSPLGDALAFAVPLIAVLQSPALAVPRATPASVESPTSVPIIGIMLDPPTLAMAGAAIASIGAYRLMKMRGRKRPDTNDSADQ